MPQSLRAEKNLVLILCLSLKSRAVAFVGGQHQQGCERSFCNSSGAIKRPVPPQIQPRTRCKRLSSLLNTWKEFISWVELRCIWQLSWSCSDRWTSPLELILIWMFTKIIPVNPGVVGCIPLSYGSSFYHMIRASLYLLALKAQWRPAYVDYEKQVVKVAVA